MQPLTPADLQEPRLSELQAMLDASVRMGLVTRAKAIAAEMTRIEEGDDVAAD